MKFFATTFTALASAGMVAAHGYVTNATIGGENYEFYQPYTDPYTSPVPDRVSRPIQGNGPVEDVSYSDIQCGGYTDGGINGSSPAALHAPATAGSNVTLFWTLWPDSHYGAVVTYMARCPDTGCNDYMPNSTAVWFKIAEGGLLDKTTNTWADTSLMVSGNDGYTYTIPQCLADGYYLVRHEIIAVFVASSYPGAQFYPGCHQLQVTGGGSTTVSDLVAFPGAYAGSDPGITYDSTADTYTIPGPTLFTCDGSSSSGSSDTSSVAAVASSSASVETTSSAVTTSAASTTSTVAAESTSTEAAVVANSATRTAAAASPSTTKASSSCSKKRGLRRSKR